MGCGASFDAGGGELDDEVDDLTDCEYRGADDETERSTDITHQRLTTVRNHRLHLRVLQRREKYLYNNTDNFYYFVPGSAEKYCDESV